MAGFAVDISRWGGNLSDTNLAGFQKENINRVIPASGPGGYGLNFQIQAKEVLHHGLALEAYTFYEWGYNIKLWIDSAIESMGMYYPEVQRFWIDIEDTTHTIPWDWKGILDIGFEYADTKFPEVGAYIPIWYMKNYLQNPSEIAVLGGKRRLWWNSWYDGDPDIDGFPYADLTSHDVAIEQYLGSTDVAGFNVDLNYVYREPQSKEDDMTPEQLEIFNNMVTLLGGADNIKEWATKDWEILAGYTEQKDKLAQHIANHPGGSVVGPHYHKTTQQTITTGDVIQQ